jgi:hypothetical protein
MFTGAAISAAVEPIERDGCQTSELFVVRWLAGASAPCKLSKDNKKDKDIECLKVQVLTLVGENRDKSAEVNVICKA